MSLIQTLRGPRICELAIFDLVLAIVATELIFSYYGAERWTGALLAVPIGVIAHAMLGINTTLNYKLGISDKIK